ncbi:MAG: hypothetical protein ACLFVZ_00180 [Actinomycetota bacterium]
MTLETVGTADDRFTSLPAWPYEPRSGVEAAAYAAPFPGPMRLPEAGHFVQEQGEQVARAALASWESE